MVGSRKIGVDKTTSTFEDRVFDKGITSINSSPSGIRRKLLTASASRSSLMAALSLYRYDWLPPGAITKERCESMLEAVVLDRGVTNDTATVSCTEHDECTVRSGVHVDLTVVFSNGYWRFDRIACPRATSRPRTLIEIKRERSDSVSAAIQARGRVSAPDNESTRAILSDVEVLGVHRDTSDL